MQKSTTKLAWALITFLCVTLLVVLYTRQNGVPDTQAMGYIPQDGIHYLQSRKKLSRLKSLPTETNTPTSACVERPPWTMKELSMMTLSELADLYHGYVNTIQRYCSGRVRVGNRGDGGWDLCLDATHSIQPPCLVYSFGINNEWSFDDAIVRNYGCEVQAYDPSMTKVDEHIRLGKIHFHRTGINGSDHVNNQGWSMRTFSSLLQENGHTNTMIDVLKMDVEHSEWIVIPEMIKSGVFKNVKQFCFEIHIRKEEINHEKYLRGMNILLDLYKEGLRIFHTNRNAGTTFRVQINQWYFLVRAGCHELCMAKDFILT